MDSAKGKIYCDPAAFLQDRDPMLLTAFERLGLAGRLRPQAHALGLTLLLPAEGSAAHKLLHKLAKNGTAEPEEFRKAQLVARACLLRRALAAPGDFSQAPVVNDLDRQLRVGEVKGRAITLEGDNDAKMVLTPVENFRDCAPFRLQIRDGVLREQGSGRPLFGCFQIEKKSEPVVDAPSADRETLASLVRKRSLRGASKPPRDDSVLGGGSVEEDPDDRALRREILNFAIDQLRARVRSGGAKYKAKPVYKADGLSPFVKLSLSLAGFLREKADKIYRDRVLPLVCFEDGDFFALVQPYWTPRAGLCHVPYANLSEWWNFLSQIGAEGTLMRAPLANIYARVQADLVAAKNNSKSPPCLRNPAGCLQKIDVSRQQLSNAVDQDLEVVAYYNSADGPLSFLSGDLREDYKAALGSLLREHELRFVVRRFMRGFERSRDHTIPARICVMLERAMAGTHLIVSPMRARCQVSGHQESVRSFINSTHFGAIPFLEADYPFDEPAEAHLEHIENVHAEAAELLTRGLRAHEETRAGLGRVAVKGGLSPSEPAPSGVTTEQLVKMASVEDLKRAYELARSQTMGGEDKSLDDLLDF